MIPISLSPGGHSSCASLKVRRASAVWEQTSWRGSVFLNMMDKWIIYYFYGKNISPLLFSIRSASRGTACSRAFLLLFFSLCSHARGD